jgi:RND family efflux transporter MFP subunit
MTPFLKTMDSSLVSHQLMVENARLDSLRSGVLLGRVSPAILDRACRDFDVARAYLRADRGDVIAFRSGLSAAQEAFERASLDLDAMTVLAPCHGTVANVSLGEGMTITAGTVLCTVLDLSSLYADVELLEHEVVRVPPGARAVVRTLAMPEDTLSGRVVTINPIVRLPARTVTVVLELAMPARERKRALPGMHVTADVEGGGEAQAVLVPRSAVVRRDERSVVFTMKEGCAKWNYVMIGDAGETMVEIRSGVVEGDTVITDGHYTLVHDARVRIRRE